MVVRVVEPLLVVGARAHTEVVVVEILARQGRVKVVACPNQFIVSSERTPLLDLTCSMARVAFAISS